MSTPFLPPQRSNAPAAAPFAPPTGSSFVPTAAPVPSFTPVEPPRRRRRRVGFAVGAVLVVAGAASAAVLVNGDEPAEAGYSLSAATAEATAAHTATMHMTVSMGSLGTVEGDFAIDNDAQLARASMDVAGSSITMVIDAAGGAAYVQMPDGLADGAWMRLDMGDLGDFGGFGDQPLSNPLDIAPLLDQASSVEDLGIVDVDGESLKHYEVGIDVADVTASLPTALPEGLDLADTLVYDVYVDGAGNLRKLSFSLDLLGETSTYDITITDLGGPVDISIPSPDEVVSMEDAFGGMLDDALAGGLGSIGG